MPSWPAVMPVVSVVDPSFRMLPVIVLSKRLIGTPPSVLEPLVEGAVGKCCKRVNVKAFQSDKCQKSCQVIILEVLQKSQCQRSKRGNVKVFQSDKCDKVLSSHHLGSVAKESMSKCFKVTSVEKCCQVIFQKKADESRGKCCKRVNVKAFQSDKCQKSCQVIILEVLQKSQLFLSDKCQSPDEAEQSGLFSVCGACSGRR